MGRRKTSYRFFSHYFRDETDVSLNGGKTETWESVPTRRYQRVANPRRQHPKWIQNLELTM